jgi:hypothetical protein
MAGVPSIDAVRAWTQIPRTAIDDVSLQQVIDGELDNQARYCRVPDLPDDYPEMLAQALYRRVAREVAGRGIPLGLLGDPASESGGLRLATFDAEVERLEGPLRIVVFG